MSNATSTASVTTESLDEAGNRNHFVHIRTTRDEFLVSKTAPSTWSVTVDGIHYKRTRLAIVEGFLVGVNVWRDPDTGEYYADEESTLLNLGRVISVR